MDNALSTQISVVIPVYGCKDCLNQLYLRLRENLEKISLLYEIVLVNDASPDGAWQVITKIANNDTKVKAINLSRNFGQHNAITAGLSYCTGEWIVIMDCDLQDNPDEIVNLYNKTKEGWKVVLGKRTIRNDGFLKKKISKLFYKLFNYLTDLYQDYTIANFGIYNKKVIESVLKMQDNVRFIPTMISWVGFESTSIEVEHNSRLEGNSSYDFKKLVKLAFGVIISFTDKPLRLTIKFGIFVSLVSFLYSIYILIRYYLGDIERLGWTSLIISIWFCSGLIIFFLGVIGLYVSRIFDKVKDRPLFIVEEGINLS